MWARVVNFISWLKQEAQQSQCYRQPAPLAAVYSLLTHVYTPHPSTPTTLPQLLTTHFQQPAEYFQFSFENLETNN